MSELEIGCDTIVPGIYHSRGVENIYLPEKRSYEDSNKKEAAPIQSQMIVLQNDVEFLKKEVKEIKMFILEMKARLYTEQTYN